MPIPRLAAAALLALAASAPAAVAGPTESRATPLEGPAPRRPGRARGTGVVAYATAERAYLDVGAADGLAAGTTVVARREGAEAARCTVDRVAEHAASCPATTLRAGDALAFQPGAEPPEPKALSPPLSDEDLAERAAALEAAPSAPLVEFKAPPQAVSRPVRRSRGISVAAGYASWTATDAAGLGAATLDVALRGTELGAGIVLDVAARAERWAPSANPRFRPGDDTRLYVWQAQLTAPLSRAILSAGRVLPYTIPGATLFDGASASIRAGPAELGVFGGLVPEPDTLSPATDRATGGGFWSLSRTLGTGAGLRQEGRLAVVRSPELGTRFEATLGGAAWWKAAYLSAEAQLGVGGEAQAAGALDAARVDVSARVAPGVSAGGGYRHTGLEWPAPAGQLEPALFPGRSEAADGWATWDVGGLRVGASGGFSRDRASKLERSWAGPEIGLPRLFGGRLRLSAGYLEERGWREGRSAWAQVAFRPGARFGLSARGTWTHDSAAVIDGDEVGLLAALSAELGRGFGLRATVLSRTVAAGGEGAGSTPLGVGGSAVLYASY